MKSSRNFFFPDLTLEGEIRNYKGNIDLFAVAEKTESQDSTPESAVAISEKIK